MRRRHVSIAVSAAALLAVGLAAGCGSQGVASPTPQTVVGTVPKETTPTVTKGDPAAGKALFASQACSTCHTFTAAGSKATIGPDLDQLADYAKKAGEPLQSYTEGAIKSPPPAYVPPGFKLVMPTTYGQTLSSKQLADLVAFLTQKS